MTKPTYEELEKRVKELERALGTVIDKAMETEHDELFELSVLYNVAQALASTRDLDELLDIAIDEVNKALLTEGTGVLLYDESRRDLYWLDVRDRRDLLGPRSAELRLPLDESIAGWVFKNRKAARVNDVTKDPRYYPGITKKSGFEFRKVLQVPLNTREKTIGVLMAINKIGGDFTEQDEVLLTSMAGIIALAIENATVYNKLRKSSDDLEMLYRSCMALASTMDLDHLLDVVMEELNKAMETEAAGILLYDQREGDLYWRAALDERKLLGKKRDDLRIPVDNSICGEVYRSGEPALVNDAHNYPRFFGEFETRSGLYIRNEIIVPLHTRDDTIGVLIVINRKDGRFAEEDVNLCSSLAGVVALAVENAEFFNELLKSYRELEDLNQVKSKIINHLSHELRTPLAIIRGTLAIMEKKLRDLGIEGFERALSRMNRHVLSLNRLESQVESIMMTGYSWERRMISGFLDQALALMEVQAERTPEIEHAAAMLRKWLEKTFPTRRDEVEEINVKEFCKPVFDYIRSRAEHEGRKVNLQVDLADAARILIPGHVLESIVEGLVRNAIEAVPDHGLVQVTGRVRGDRFLFRVKDTGMGIPEKSRDLIFEGFCPVQETEDYSSGRPYSFNAGGKGIDLLRIRMFSELYNFKVSYTSKRCTHLGEESEFPGDAANCPHCAVPQDCAESGGSEFLVDFPLSDGDSQAKPAVQPA
jgi:GAF domain-containing protein